MIKIENGHYQGNGFTVFLTEKREYNYKTGGFRMVRFWSFNVSGYCADGYATKKQAAEAAARYLEIRAA